MIICQWRTLRLSAAKPCTPKPKIPNKLGASYSHFKKDFQQDSFIGNFLVYSKLNTIRGKLCAHTQIFGAYPLCTTK